MKTDREKAVLMLKTCRGQIDATLKMIENGRYCMDIVNQILAAEALLKKSNKLILKQHMDHCVKAAFKTEDAEEKLNEVMDILTKIMK
ncbi:MAG: metal-sensing transcriptional repressor [Fusobacteriaceae bacterium]